MKKIVVSFPNASLVTLTIPPSVVGNTSFAHHLSYLFRGSLQGYEAVSCERVYESGSAYPYPQKDWDSNPMGRSTCPEYRLKVKPITQQKETIAMPNPYEIAAQSKNPRFTSVKEQVKHEIFGVDITTADKDSLIELANFINKKIAVAEGLNLSTSRYIHNEIKTLRKLLDKTIAKLDEGVEA